MTCRVVERDGHFDCSFPYEMLACAGLARKVPGGKEAGEGGQVGLHAWRDKVWVQVGE